MKYKEWTGELEGNVPDLGSVSKGRVLLIDSTPKEAAAETYKGSLKDLPDDEGQRRYQEQVQAETPARAEDPAPEPVATPQETAPAVEPATTPTALPYTFPAVAPDAQEHTEHDAGGQ
jgi:hypothetical protein